jgi:hypothetical protein
MVLFPLLAPLALTKYNPHTQNMDAGIRCQYRSLRRTPSWIHRLTNAPFTRPRIRQVPCMHARAYARRTGNSPPQGNCAATAVTVPSNISQKGDKQQKSCSSAV